MKEHALQINHDKEKDYYYIWDLIADTQIVDDDGNPIRFRSMDEATEYVNNF